MLHSVQSIIGFTMGATDGEIGKVKDVYFDDKTWKIRYLVVETGNWLFGRKVLLSPVALQNPEWDAKVLPVNLTKDQIKDSPDIDTEKPVTHQHEADLHSHYSWPMNPQGGIGFMTTGMVGGVVAPDVPFEERIAEEMHHHDKDTISDRGPENTDRSSEHHSIGDSHLRSFKDFSGSTLSASDGDAGEIDDMLINTSNWNIPFVIVETGNWYEGDKILVSTNTIHADEPGGSFRIAQATSTLNNCPAYHDNEPIDESLEQKFYLYHDSTNRNL